MTARAPVLALTAVGVLVGVGAFWVLAPNNSGSIDGIRCEAEHSAYHIHVKLTVNGIPPPNDLGHGSGGCLYWIHTHGIDGIVHIEAPAGFVPTMSKVAFVWRGTDPDGVVDAFAAAAWGGTATINGAPATADTPLKDGDVIVAVGAVPGPPSVLK
jgi:hypothetical protein